MKRRTLLSALFALVVPLLIAAQPAGKVARIGVLRWGPQRESPQLREALSRIGYRDGENIAIEWRSATQRDDLERHAAELVRLRVDVIVAYPTPAAHAARDATRSIPIVLGGVADPVSSGLVSSLARPGGNITGWTLNLPALGGKRIQLLKESLPDVGRVAFLGSTTDPATALFLEETQIAARTAGVRIQVVTVGTADEFATAFAEMVRERAQAVIVQPLFIGNHSSVIAALSQRHGLPSISDLRNYPEAGGLMSYGPSRASTSRLTATYIDRILRGAAPGALAIEQPREYELVINLNTARALGLTIPQSLLLRADEVIQ